MTADARVVALERRRIPKVRLALGVSCLIVIVALLFAPSLAPWLLRFEHSTADWRTALLSDRLPTQNSRIVLVVINDDTLKDYPSSPVDRGLLSKIVRAIDAAGARVIGLDVLFLKKTDADKDQSLVDALRTAKAAVVLGALDERGEIEAFQREFQTSFLEKAGRPAGYLNLRHEHDDVVRYIASPMPQSAFAKSFARLLAEAGGATAADAGQPISWLLPPRDGSDTFLTIPAQDLVAADGTGETQSRSSAASKLKDRIVLIGGDFPLRDRHRVPLSARDGKAMPGVTIHAQILAGMLDPRRQIAELRQPSAQLLLLVVAAMGFLLGWLLWQSTIVGFLGWGFATAVLLGIDMICFTELRLLLPFTLALVAWVAGVTAGRSLRFVAASALRLRSSPA